MKCLKMLTFLPIDQLEQIESWDPSRINEKKELLAFELTKLVHGEEEAQKALEASHSLFSGDKSNAIELLVACKLAPSKGEARRLIQQGGVTVNEEKVTSFDVRFTREQLQEGLMIRKGKKTYIKAVLA